MIKVYMLFFLCSCFQVVASLGSFYRGTNFDHFFSKNEAKETQDLRRLTESLRTDFQFYLETSRNEQLNNSYLNK